MQIHFWTICYSSVSRSVIWPKWPAVSSADAEYIFSLLLFILGEIECSSTDKLVTQVTEMMDICSDNIARRTVNMMDNDFVLNYFLK